MPRRYYSSTAARTTLSSSCNNSDTTLSVTAVTGWPSSFPYTLIIDQDTINEEVVNVTARTGTTLTVERGQDGTAAVSHSAGAAVNHGVSARDFNEPNQFLNEGGTVTGATLITATSGTALEVRNTGTGNSLLVEDSASPDSTPFVVDASGKVVVGHSSALNSAAATSVPLQIHGSTNSTTGVATARWNADATPVFLHLSKSRGAVGIHTVVVDGDQIGTLRFSGSDGTEFIRAAEVSGEVDGTPGTNDMPGRLVFSTTADGASTPTERMRITSAGNVGIGTSSPEVLVDVYGTSGTVRFRADGSAGFQVRSSNDTPSVGPVLVMTRARGTDASRTLVSSGDTVGNVNFQGYDGATNRNAAQISAAIDSTPGAGDMPGRLVFSTTADGASTPTERMRIDSAGNVGIGRTSPGRSLDVEGNIRAISSTGTTSINVVGDGQAAVFSAARYSTDGTPSDLQMYKYRGTEASPTVVADGDDVGRVRFYAYDGSSLREAVRIMAEVDGTPGASDMPGRLTFWTTADGAATPTERMRINNAGLITGTGTSLGAWTSYTPTLGGTGWAIGNGTAAGAYCQIGKIVHFRARIVFGSTSTAGAGASPSLTMPVASAGAGSVWPITGRILDASASLVYLIGWQPVSTTVCQLNTIGTNGLQGQINSTTPFTWAVSDELMLTGTYEAA